MEKKSIEIRDLRNQDWLWTSKKLLFHEKIDGNNYKVYGGLAAYANNSTQEAFPSIETLSNKLHMSRNTVIKSLGVLQKVGFIKIEKTTGEHNIYVLLNKNEEIKEMIIVPPKAEEKSATLPAVPVKTYAEQVFDRFWAIYPNHANKKMAEKKFLKLSKETILIMANDVKKRKIEHDGWLKGFIPHLATYINQERWNDPIIKSTGEKKDTKPFIHPELRKKLFKENNENRFHDTMESAQGAKSIGELIKKN